MTTLTLPLYSYLLKRWGPPPTPERLAQVLRDHLALPTADVTVRVDGSVLINLPGAGERALADAAVLYLEPSRIPYRIGEAP